MTLERNLSIIMIVFSSFFLVMSLQIENRTGNFIAPGAWPAALMLLMLILSVFLLIRTFKAKKNQNIQKSDSENEADDEKLVYPKRFFLMLVILAVYTFVLGYVGFIVSTIFGVFALAILFGMKGRVRPFLTGVLSTAGSIVLFPILLNLPFPRGIGIFQVFSLMFY
ncbi:hypothetical protein KIS4809_3319 [Bacillus sp. ZZV12-4809]|nr:hypothetical protein KIS4809_3319 [Bacillus sp. ZZV12-4809]